MKYIKYHLTLSILQARLWLLTFGFTLSFGALFAKTWQVYRIYTNPKLKNEVNCFVCLFVFLDYMICLPLCSFLPSLSPFILILLLLFPFSFLFSYLPPFLSPVLPISPPRPSSLSSFVPLSLSRCGISWSYLVFSYWSIPSICLSGLDCTASAGMKWDKMWVKMLQASKYLTTAQLDVHKYTQNLCVPRSGNFHCKIIFVVYVNREI